MFAVLVLVTRPHQVVRKFATHRAEEPGQVSAGLKTVAADVRRRMGLPKPPRSSASSRRGYGGPSFQTGSRRSDRTESPPGDPPRRPKNEHRASFFKRRLFDGDAFSQLAAQADGTPVPIISAGGAAQKSTIRR